MLFSNMYTQLERFEYLDKCDPLLYLLWGTKLFPTRCRDWILKDLEQEGLEWQPCSQKEVFAWSSQPVPCVKQQWFKWLNHETSLFNYKLTAIVRCPGQRTPLPQTVALDIYHTLENDQEASDNQKAPPLQKVASQCIMQWETHIPEHRESTAKWLIIWLLKWQLKTLYQSPIRFLGTQTFMHIIFNS